MKLPEHYRRPVFIAILIHIVIFSILIINFAPTMFRAPPASAPMQTIHATAIVQASDRNAHAEPLPKPISSDRSARASERAVEEKKQAAITAKKVLVLHQEKLAKLQASEKIKKIKAEKLKQEKIAKAAEAKRTRAEAERAKQLAKAKKLLAEQKQLQQKLMQQALNSEQKSLAVVQSQQGAVDKYKAEILSLVQSNWRIDRVNDKLKCIYSISLAPDGSVLSVTLVKSSGDDNLDQSARQAIMQSSPLPVPQDPGLFDHFRQLVLTLSPQGFVTG